MMTCPEKASQDCHHAFPNANASSDKNTTTNKKTKGSRAGKAKAAETINFSGGDQSLATTINFIRMTFWYLEMCSATAEGDIGRVFEVIKVPSLFRCI